VRDFKGSKVLAWLGLFLREHNYLPLQTQHIAKTRTAEISVSISWAACMVT